MRYITNTSARPIGVGKHLRLVPGERAELTPELEAVLNAHKHAHPLLRKCSDYKPPMDK